MTELRHIPYPIIFHDWHGEAIRHDSTWWLSPRQISDHLGLDWKSQYRKITKSNLSTCVVIMTTQVSGQGRETLMLPLAYFGAWLLSISVTKVAPEKRDLVSEMQREMLLSLDHTLSTMLSLPGEIEADDLVRLPVPQEADEAGIMAARAALLHDPVILNAVRLYRMGLPATKAAPQLGQTLYWVRRQRKRFEALGLVNKSWQALRQEAINAAQL